MEHIYLSGFGNHFSTEAEPGALPIGQNNPQQAPHDLYAEQLSGSAFTMSRHENLRTWLYRRQPSAVQGEMKPLSLSGWTSQLTDTQSTPPQALRWKPFVENKDTHFLGGVRTMVANATNDGSAVSLYSFNQAMGDEYFYNADGDLVFVPFEGGVLLKTEMGVIELEPMEMAVVPRGVRFQVEPQKPGTWCRGYLGENLGAPFRLPDLGPIGANGLANSRDFLSPCAAYENKKGSVQLICKFQNRFWSGELGQTPLNVVAWHGNYAPYKYDLRLFNTMGSISYDHPDPSIFTVLTSPSSVPGRANVDFVVFPPRWLVAEKTFRPPYYHRNIMSEFMGLISGVYDAKQGGFVPGGSSLHNCMTAHGPDAETFKKELQRSETPQKIGATMAFMFESSQIYQASSFALSGDLMDKDYLNCWNGL